MMRGAAVRAALGAAVAAALLAAPAQASLQSLEASCSARDAADGDTANGVALGFTFCDDGIPAAGGTTPNPGAELALAVPQHYGGDRHSGLPPKAPPDPDSGADDAGDVALDADLSVPHLPAPPGGYPLMVLMHTCCSSDKRNFEADTIDAPGELWHYSNAWYAARGYAVLNYTSRGFVDGQGHGSTGHTQLDSRDYEVNDLQHLACQLAAAGDLDPARPGAQRIDPSRVVVSGGSYGGGLAWMALTDPAWSCANAGHGEISMRLAAAAPRYGWSDLVYALIPNGSQRDGSLPPSDPVGAWSKSPLGMPRTSIVAALYGTGKAGDPRTAGHTTFTPEIENAIACLESATPLEQNPLCTTTGVVPGVVDSFLADRSSYYQAGFFQALRRGAVAPVPVFSAGSSTSPLFGQVEHRRMADRLRTALPGYPIQEYYGDVGDFTQSKAKEWGDLCGADAHVCALRDYPAGDPGRAAGGLDRVGIATRLNRFVDHYARPAGNRDEPAPAFDVTASLQICAAGATDAFPVDAPGERITESSFGDLAPERLRLTAAGAQTTQNKAAPNEHAANAEPISNFAFRGAACPVETSDAGPGVAVYDLPALNGDVTMIGRPAVTVPHTGAGTDLQLNARLYEVLSDGSQVLVDRGTTRVADANGTTAFDLQGNGWRFGKGDRLRIELAQDDDPYVKASGVPSSLTLEGVTVDLPVRRSGPDAVVQAPELVSSVSVGRRVPVRVAPRSGELAGVTRTEVTATDTLGGAGRAVGTSFTGRAGRTYRVAARLFDGAGAGEPATALTVVPFDDTPSALLRYRGRWSRVGDRAAWGGAFRRAAGRGAGLSFRFRGDRMYLVGRVSRAGGRALVLVGGRRRVVSFASRRTGDRRVVLRMKTDGSRSTRVRLTVLSGRVEVDAIGFRRQ